MSTKTIDEIKLGLERCEQGDCASASDECPYFSISSCSRALKADALAYINELEERTSLNTMSDEKIVTRCKDCKRWGSGCPSETDKIKCCQIAGYLIGENGYCLYAEAKDEGRRGVSDKREVRLIDANALLDDLQELLTQEVIGNTVSNAGNGIALAMQRIMRAKETTLNTLRDAIYEDAVAHGLWDEYYPTTDCVDFIRDEVLELEYAAMNWRTRYDESSKFYPEFCQALADVIIMSLSVAGYLGIDIDAAVRRKMEINRSRPWKYGKETGCNT